MIWFILIKNCYFGWLLYLWHKILENLDVLGENGLLIRIQQEKVTRMMSFSFWSSKRFWKCRPMISMRNTSVMIRSIQKQHLFNKIAPNLSACSTKIKNDSRTIWQLFSVLFLLPWTSRKCERCYSCENFKTKNVYTDVQDTPWSISLFNFFFLIPLFGNNQKQLYNGHHHERYPESITKI